MLRLDAERFGTAEYYEATRDGERPRSAAGWPGTAWARRSPSPSCSSTRRRSADLFLGSGDRLGAVLGGLAYGAARDRRSRSASRRSATTGSASRTRGRTRARCSTRPPPRSSTRSPFRGALFGLLLIAGVDPTLANLIQALLYTLTTRLGAPGRDRYLLVLTLGIGLIGGWLTVATGGIAAAFLGHADHPLRGLPVHRPHRPDQAARPRGRGDREAPPAARRLAGHRLAGVAPRGIGDVGAAVARAAGRALRPRPVLRLALPVLRLRGRAPAPRRAARGRGSAAFVEALARELDLRADALDAAFGPDAAAARDASTSAAGRRRSCRPTTSPRLLDAGPRALRPRRRRRGHARGEPGPGRARRPGGAPRAPASPASRSARSRFDAAELRRLGRRHRAVDVADAVAEARGGRHRLGQPRPAVRRARRDAGRLDRRRSTRRSRSSPTTCRSTR